MRYKIWDVRVTGGGLLLGKGIWVSIDADFSDGAGSRMKFN